VATLPKPRYSSSASGARVWPESKIHPISVQEPLVSASSSMFGLQAQAPSLPSPEPMVAEPGVIHHLSRRLRQLRAILARVARWWMELDFRHAQLPILVLALGVWAVTARMAWQGEESATPLLRESISEIRQERAKAAMGTVGPALAPRASGAAPTTSIPAPTEAPAKPAAGGAARPQPATTIQRNAQNSSRRGSGWLASIQSWFAAEPAAREKVQGNPHRRVWVDMKTGLYYCPGADDYYGFGGRERGKVMLQRDAEYDYFQPASGAPCQ
jgi:hypothetical protein